MKYIVLCFFLVLVSCNKPNQERGVLSVTEKQALKKKLLKAYEEFKKKSSEKDFVQSIRNVEGGIVRAKRLHEIKLKNVDDPQAREKQDRLLALTIQRLNREKEEIRLIQQETENHLQTLKAQAETEYKLKANEALFD